MKIITPQNNHVNDFNTVADVTPGIVYQNVKNKDCYLYQTENQGFNILIVDGVLYLFEQDHEVREYLQDDDLPDMWNETNLHFSLSLSK